MYSERFLLCLHALLYAMIILLLIKMLFISIFPNSLWEADM